MRPSVLLVGLGVALAVAAAPVAAPAALGAQAPRDTAAATHGDPARTVFAPELGVDLRAMRRLPSGVLVRDIEVGTGSTAAPGREVTIGYILYLADGREVERSVPTDPPVRFTIGKGQVIRGWDVGLRGMRAGGTRMLVVPSRLAYGGEGTDKVPPHAVLVFVVSLDAVR